MKGLAPEESSRYLSVLAELKASCRFYDTHVHPYEVLFDRFSYDESGADSKAVSLPGRSYTAPQLSTFSFPEAVDFNEAPQAKRLQEISVMLLRKIYGSVGERVFSDQMGVAGIDRVLLLPVATESADAGEFDSRMRWVKRLYGDLERFWIAGSIPVSLKGEEIRSYAESLQQRYGIRAIKCHPVVSALDLGSGEGKSWLEAMLATCQDLKLPVIIHGGRNNAYWGGSRGNFGSLHHLKEIDFSLSRQPVILAHAGVHRCKLLEVEQESLPMLQKMLTRHDNLQVDVSGLGLEALKLILRRVDHDRILFGSDALYAPQWQVVTMTMHALKELGMKWEEKFIQIASINPQNSIFKGDSHA